MARARKRTVARVGTLPPGGRLPVGGPESRSKGGTGSWLKPAILGLVLVAAPAPLRAANPCPGAGLVLPQLYAAGSEPRALAAGDFDGDGDQDLVVANYDADTVSLLRGDGTGGLAAPVAFGVGLHPVALAVGDFDEDGHPDVAAANYFGNSVSILLGDGAGGFATAASFGARAPTAVVAADFDLDGHLDLVFGSDSSENVFLVRGDGAGSSVPPRAGQPAARAARPTAWPSAT